MVLRSNNNKSCNHSKFEAFKAVLNFSKDESRDKQKPLEAGTSGKSGIFSPNILKDSGPEIKKRILFKSSSKTICFAENTQPRLYD